MNITVHHIAKTQDGINFVNQEIQVADVKKFGLNVQKSYTRKNTFKSFYKVGWLDLKDGTRLQHVSVNDVKKLKELLTEQKTPLRKTHCTYEELKERYRTVKATAWVYEVYPWL